MCNHLNCTTHPTFNYEGKSERLYCSVHKLDGMINVKAKICISPNCTTRSSFNYHGELKALYCNTHKLNGMINIFTKICITPNCMKYPSFNYHGELKALYCTTHKLVGMINVRNKNCISQNCMAYASFNYEGKSNPLYCSIHKLDGMNIVSTKMCISPICAKRSSFNYHGELKSLYCNTHKLDGMINVRHKICKTPLCYTLVKEKYNGYCIFCYVNLFPDKPVSHNYKTKEYSVVEHVEKLYPNFSWISDKKIKDGCSKRRPDLLLDLGYQVIIIEIDENQHVTYDCSCENKRIMQLSEDVGHRPIIFIRFNPDDYLNGTTKITSCWSLNKKGLCVIKKSKQDEWLERLKTLEQQIDYWIDPFNSTDKTVELIQLFYDF